MMLKKKLNDTQQDYIDANQSYVDAVDNSTEAFKNLNDIQNETGISGEELYNQVEKGIINYKDMTTEQQNVYKAYLDNIEAEKNLKTSTEDLTEAKRLEKNC